MPGATTSTDWTLKPALQPIGRLARQPSALVYLGVQRNWAKDPGEAFWRGELGFGILKEIGWGLRPQLTIDFARQLHEAQLAPFGKVRRDWLLEGSFSIYKRDWNIGGFAPSLSVTITSQPLHADALRRKTAPHRSPSDEGFLT